MMNNMISSPNPNLKLPKPSDDSISGVSRIEHKIFLWTVAPEPNVEQVQDFARTLSGLTADLDHYYLLVDLTRAERLNGAAWDFLSDYLRRQEKLHHFAVVTGKDILLAIAARFVLSHIGVQSSSFEGTCEQALRKIKEIRCNDEQQENHPRSFA